MRSVHILVTGRVQGVFYRVTMKTHAKELGLKGFVRNLSTGKVEIHAQGERVEEFLRYVQRGSPSSRVDDIRVHDIDEEEYDGFDII